LVIAKLDRFSRDARFLIEPQKAGIKFDAADIPEANEMIVGIMAVIAQSERKMISARRRAALQAAAERGVKLGGDRENLPAVSAKGGLAALEKRRKAARQRAADPSRSSPNCERSGLRRWPRSPPGSTREALPDQGWQMDRGPGAAIGAHVTHGPRPRADKGDAGRAIMRRRSPPPS
jgi:hypothetical protein